MNTPTLEHLCMYKDAALQLVQMGVSFNELAQVGERRLEMILKYFDVAKIAIELTNAREVLGLNNKPMVSNPNNLLHSKPQAIGNVTAILPKSAL